MKTSWAALGLSPAKMAAVVVLAASGAAVFVLVAAFAVLGEVSFLLAGLVGGATGYAIAGFPKRSLARSALLQAREAPELAASAAMYLQSTGSRAKTIMMLHSNEPRLDAMIEQAKRATLLGIDAEAAFGPDGAQADSTAGILSSVVRAQGERLADGGEELEGMVRASLASEETKFPVFLTVSFFLPIMLMLLAAVGHHDDLTSVLSLSVVELVILDLALSFASAERKRLSP